MNFQIVPLEFLPSVGGQPQPKDPYLYEAVQRYCKEQFDQNNYQWCYDVKTWVMAGQDDSGYVVKGIVSVRNMLDCHTFHVSPGTDAESWKQAEGFRDALLYRAASFITDNFGRGARVQVYVAPIAVRLWRKFLEKIGAKQSNRWEVTLN